jgi:hypothetical protein
VASDRDVEDFPVDVLDYEEDVKVSNRRVCTQKKPQAHMFDA